MMASACLESIEATSRERNSNRQGSSHKAPHPQPAEAPPGLTLASAVLLAPAVGLAALVLAGAGGAVRRAALRSSSARGWCKPKE